MCCPSLVPQMTGGLSPPILAIENVSDTQSPADPELPNLAVGLVCAVATALAARVCVLNGIYQALLAYDGNLI